MSEYGGLIVAPGGSPGALVTQAGQVQYGDMLLGSGTSAGWLELVGWRDAPAGVASDYSRPQAHGSYPGAVYGESVVVTYVFLLRGTPAEKATALAAIERYAPMDGVDRMLAVNDCDDGVWFRMGRLIGRNIPQPKHFNHAPVEGSLQFLCADPRRYSLTLHTGVVELPMSAGGLEYPLEYPLEYGTWGSGALVAANAGSEHSPLVATFRGPLTNPGLHNGTSWRLGFDITLAAGESLVVDTHEGTVLLNGSTDRGYTISPQADPVELCLLPPGDSPLSLSADAGTGTVTVNYRDARM